jgi:hypothetical protein
VGGVDLNKPRIRTVLAAVLALAPSPTGFRVSDLAAKVTSMTLDIDRAYTRRQAAYDLKKLRVKGAFDSDNVRGVATRKSDPWFCRPVWCLWLDLSACSRGDIE